MNKRQSWNIVTLFLLLIFGLTAAAVLKPDKSFSENENRALASMPKLSLDSLLSGEFATVYLPGRLDRHEDNGGAADFPAGGK